MRSKWQIINDDCLEALLRNGDAMTGIEFAEILEKIIDLYKERFNWTIGYEEADVLESLIQSTPKLFDEINNEERRRASETRRS